MRIEQPSSFTRNTMNSWLAWITICVVSVVVILPNLGLWPRVSQDEVQIIEFGREFLNPDTDWSANWSLNQAKPVYPQAILGAIPQEIAYQITAPSNFGPRFWTLLGAIIAATLMFQWLILRGTPHWAALILATVFLLDPVFNTSYRMGRVDSWALVWIFSACVYLRLMYSRIVDDRPYWLLLLAAVASSITAYFVWPTALALYPLVLLEFLIIVWSSREINHRAWNNLIKFSILMASLAIIVFLGLVTYTGWDTIVAALGLGRAQQAAAEIQYSIIGMFVIRNPFLILVLVTALLIKRDLGLLLAASAALLMMSQTMMYPMRILYLLPYLIALIAGAFITVGDNKKMRWRHATLVSLLALVLAWEFGTSLIKRPLMAAQQADARRLNQLSEVLEDSIGRGPLKVLMVEWEFYYAARDLGWRTYKLIGTFDRNSEAYANFLSSMDYAIIRENLDFFKGVRLTDIEDAGYELIATISFEKAQTKTVDLGFYQFSVPDKIYEDVAVYRNTAKPEEVN